MKMNLTQLYDSSSVSLRLLMLENKFHFLGSAVVFGNGPKPCPLPWFSCSLWEWTQTLSAVEPWFSCSLWEWTQTLSAAEPLV